MTKLGFASDYDHPLTTSVGQPIILYIAAMGNIDNPLVEAARVDGATEFQVSGRSKWPSLFQQLLHRDHHNHQLISSVLL